MFSIRKNVFETNSSSTHSLCICTESENMVMTDNNEILNSLIRILEKSFYEGYNNEQPLDRKLFAQFLINNGVVLREI